MAREGALDVLSRKGTPQDVLSRGENVPLRLIAYRDAWRRPPTALSRKGMPRGVLSRGGNVPLRYRDALGNSVACDGAPPTSYRVRGCPRTKILADRGG